MIRVSESQIEDFSRFIKHPAYQHVQEVLSKRLYEKWLVGSDEERKDIGDIHASGEMFHKELKRILDNIGDKK